jgi:hypothetical protein
LAVVKLLKVAWLQVPLANLLVVSQRKLHRELMGAHQSAMLTSLKSLV